MGISRLRSHGKIKPEIGANRGAYSDRMSGNEFALPDELEQPLGNLMLAVGRMAAYRPTVQAGTVIAKVGFRGMKSHPHRGGWASIVTWDWKHSPERAATSADEPIAAL